MAESKTNRGPAPKEPTLRMLCGKSAGICEFRGCNERLFYDNITTANFNAAYVAHIIASNPGGPRGDKELSHKLSDKLENLMLMCAKHHTLVDDPTTGEKNFPVKLLQDMKREHEENVERVCNYLNTQKTEVVNFISPIKGNQVNVIYDDTLKAIVFNEKQPASQYGTIIKIDSILPITDKNHWDDLEKKLRFEFEYKIKAAFDRFNDMHFSLFPLAPMPLIIKLGELFGDKTNVDIFQKTRMPDTWKWLYDDLTNKFLTEKSILGKGKDVALIISLTDTIEESRITNVIKPSAVYKIIAEHNGVDCIKSERDLSEFWHIYQRVCDEIFNTFGTDSTIHLFAAMPVSAAFEVGRRRMPGLYPKITIYDDNNGFKPTITIGG